MKKFSFLMLCMVLIFGACQENLDVLSEEQTELETNAKDVLWMMKKVDRGITTKAVGLKDKFWNVGDTIRIKFLPGGSYNQQLEEAVKRYAQIWLDKTKADLFFKYVSPEDYADVKIGFDLDERWMSWSTIGTDCKTVPQDEPSLNFTWLDELSEDGFRGEILKGFGFVLGLVFEHQSPVSPIVFKPNASARLMEDYNLSVEDVNTILTQYTTFETKADTFFDKTSIMTLHIPRTIIEDPRTATVTNTDLSVSDINFIHEKYAKSYLLRMITHKPHVSFDVERISDIDVDWGDGIIETNVFEHHYTDSMEYRITFNGDSLALRKLICRESGISLLQLEKNVNLQILNCSNNNISDLNLDKLPQLTEIYCDTNELVSLNFENNPLLRSIHCDFNSIRYLNVTKNLLLENLVFRGNIIRHLDISHNLALKRLIFLFNSVSELDLSKHTALQELDCGGNRFESIDFSKNVNLITLRCGSNLFDTLDISQNKELRNLYCEDLNLRHLDISNNKLLQVISCRKNKLTSLDLSLHEGIFFLDCYDNQISNLDLSKCRALNTMDCGANQLTSFNVGHNLYIRYICCDNNPFVTDPVELENFARSLPLSPVQYEGHLYLQNSESEQLIQDICSAKYWECDQMPDCDFFVYRCFELSHDFNILLRRDAPWRE